MGICTFNQQESHLIEITEEQENTLLATFEHFSHIDEATKKRVIKS